MTLKYIVLHWIQVFQSLEYVSRVGHGYGKTRSVSKMNIAGTGMGMDFGTPWHT